jgi:hypothetical protein
MNRVVLKRLKKKIEKAKQEWIDLLDKILWAYKTIRTTFMGETPFLLTCSRK